MNLFKGFNDYELLYLIHEFNEDAMRIMMEKYQYFIYKKISEYRINEAHKEDFFQEGLIVLNEAILKYDQAFNKTFLRFFEMFINRRFYYLVSILIKNQKTITEMTYNFSEKTNDLLEDIVVEYASNKHLQQFHSQIEKDVYLEYFINQKKVKMIEKAYSYNCKQIYNAIYRIKKKISK